MNDLVSIIIPCYQQGSFLPQAIESALAQTHPHTEIIVVNDGSTDDTAQVARDYAGRHPGRFKPIEQSNRGQARARQAGLEAATGAWLVMLDADDLLEPDMIESCLNAFAAHPEIDAVVGDAWMIDEEGRRGRSWPQRRIVPWPQILRNNPYGALAAIMTRTASVRAVGGLAVDGTPGVEDWDLWARMARRGMKFLPLGVPLGCYRQTVSGTSRKARQMLAATIEMLERCRRGDPRLNESAARAVQPPIGEALYQELRNGKVFKYLGLALSGGAGIEEIESILAFLVPGALSVRTSSDQFLEGVHYGFFLQRRQTLPPGLDLAKILEVTGRSLAEHALTKYDSALRRAIARTFTHPLRKRSVWARLQERLGTWRSR